jgi:hypothetical protein
MYFFIKVPFSIISSKNEERRKIILHIFVEKPGFSPLMRAKQLKIANCLFFLLFLTNLHPDRSKKSGKVEKNSTHASKN